MLTDAQIETLQPKLLLARIITAAMIMGVLVLAIVAHSVAPFQNAELKLSMLPLLGAAASFFLLLMSFVVPALTASSIPAAAGDPEDERLKTATGIWLTNRILRLAPIEAGAFLNLVLYLLDKSLLSIVAAAVCVFFMMLAFPLRSAMVGWLESRLNS